MSAKPRRRRESGSLGQLKARLWVAIEYSVGVIDAEDQSHDVRLRAVSALSTAAGVYARVLYDHEIEQRLAALEQADAARVEGNGHYG